MKDASKRTDLAFKNTGDTLILIGKTAGWLGATLYLREIEGREEGAPPPVDLKAEKRNGDFVRKLIQTARVNACHDLSDGGLLVAIAEMALAGKSGADLALKNPTPALLFGEDQARYLVTTAKPQTVLAAAKKAKIPALLLGTVSAAPALTLNGKTLISVEALRTAHEAWLPGYMSAKN